MLHVWLYLELTREVQTVCCIFLRGGRMSLLHEEHKNTKKERNQMTLRGKTYYVCRLGALSFSRLISLVWGYCLLCTFFLKGCFACVSYMYMIPVALSFLSFVSASQCTTVVFLFSFSCALTVICLPTCTLPVLRFL